MKHLLFVYGEYTNKPNHIAVIGDIISELTVNKCVKYQHGAAGAIYHFESKESIKYIGKYLEDTITDLTAMFFLVPMTDEVLISVDDMVMSHLFNLENETTNSNFSFDINKTVTNEDTDKTVAELVNEIAKTLIEELAPQEGEVKIPTLDELLDKINTNGINSLTKKEKQLLDEYAKN
jgi:hypothetical protein